MPRDPLFLVAINMFVAVIARCYKPNLLTAFLLAIVLMASSAYLGTQCADDILTTMSDGRDALCAAIGIQPSWPPTKNKPFADLRLVDQDGNPTKMSEFRGKVILLEFVGMSCPACVAFSGGREHGPFRDTWPQPDLESVAEYSNRFARTPLDDPQIVYVQLVLFNEQMQAPSAEEVKVWAEHFHLQRASNQIVLGGTPALAKEISQALVPGFLLIDKDFVVRMDSTGSRPLDNLYTDLLPLMGSLVQEQMLEQTATVNDATR